MVPGSTTKLLAQMRRGAIEYCVLALLRDQDLYGLELARTLAEADGLVTSEGTVYPLLTRLRRDGLVDATWEESPNGRPRRYYRITKDGRAALKAFSVQWSDSATPSTPDSWTEGGTDDRRPRCDRWAEYVADNAAVADLSAGDRQQIVEQVSEHISSAVRCCPSKQRPACATSLSASGLPRTLPPRRGPESIPSHGEADSRSSSPVEWPSLSLCSGSGLLRPPGHFRVGVRRRPLWARQPQRPDPCPANHRRSRSPARRQPTHKRHAVAACRGAWLHGPVRRE